MSKSRTQKLRKARAEEKATFRRKEKVYKLFNDIRQRTAEAYDAMKIASEGCRLATETMNHEYELMQNSNSKRHQSAICDEYRRIYNNCKEQINHLRREIDSEHEQMVTCFRQSRSMRKQGNGPEAALWEAEAYDHADRRDVLKVEVEDLFQYIERVKKEAEQRLSEVESTKLLAAKTELAEAKEHYQEARDKFESLRDERDRLKDELDSAKAEHARAKSKLNLLLGNNKTQSGGRYES